MDKKNEKPTVNNLPFFFNSSLGELKEKNRPSPVMALPSNIQMPLKT